MDKPDYSTARCALAHGTELARQRKATTFLWSFEKLLSCFPLTTGFNHEFLGPLTVDTLLTFMKRCTSPVLPDGYQGYRLALAPIALKPYNVRGRNSEIIRCRPVLPTCNRPELHGAELRGTESVAGGDYVVFFKDPSGVRNIYEPCFQDTSEPDYAPLFIPLNSLKRVPSFFKMTWRKKEHEISDELKAIAGCTLPHNGHFQRCIVTGKRSTGGPEDPGSIEARWIYPPSVLGWHVGPTNNSKELSWNCWEPDSDVFNGPGNLIAMRKDLYDLFHKNAFGIDIDALPRARIYIFDPSQVAQVKSISLPQHPIMEVNDPMARAFLREHFQRCLLTGIIGGDVSDDFGCTQNRIQLMLSQRLQRSTEQPDIANSWWKTAMGDALNEWLSYEDSLEAEDDDDDDED